MTETTTIGRTQSADIAVPEHDRELRFYARVLGTGDAPLWRDDLMNNAGTPVIGLGARSPEYEQLPLQWMPHIQVADVAVSVKNALSLGGKDVMHARNDDGESLWAVLVDPNGAAFGIIPAQPATEPGSALGSVGRICGLDLAVPDAAAAVYFYREVIGWSAVDVPADDADGTFTNYELGDSSGQKAAEIRQARGGSARLPAVWILRLPVGDLAESLRRVAAEGAKVIKVVADGDGEPVSAVVADPVGAVIGLVAG